MRRTNRIVNIRFVALAVALLLVLGGIPQAQAAETSGAAGGVSWEISSGVLTISGSGVIPDYQENIPAPWLAYADSIRSIQVKQGVTGIGNFAFFRLGQVTSVALPDSVTRIGDFAFFGCRDMEMIELGSGVKEIGQSAFEECISLLAVRLPDSLKTLRFHAFYRCESLVSVTIPASVTKMEKTVFAYCKNLQNAVVLANISTLPEWSFYSCPNLKEVSLASNIGAVEYEAFENCESLPNYDFPVATPSNRIETGSITVKQENNTTIVNSNSHTTQSNSSINVQAIQKQSDTGNKIEIQVDAVLDNNKGWQELQDQLDPVITNSDTTVDTNVRLSGQTEISGDDLSRFAGKDVDLTIRTQQGALWHVNGMHINAEELEDTYDLSFTLRPIDNPTDEQIAVVGIGSSFIVEFHSDINFKVEVELSLGNELKLGEAAFFALEKDGYHRMQTTIIDEDGIAHFFLQNVQKDTEYLIGINVNVQKTDSAVNNAIVPESLQNNHNQYEQIEQVEYIVVGRKSSWGMDIGQVTWILAGVMIGSFVIVGVVVFAVFKRRVKKGYVPDMRYEDEIEE